MNLSDKLRSLVNSPKGRGLVQRGQTELSKPENQRKLRSLLDRRRRSR